MSTLGLVLIIAGALIVYWAIGAHKLGGGSNPAPGTSGGRGVV